MFVYVAHNITTITTVATDKYGKTSHIIGPGLTKNIKKDIYSIYIFNFNEMCQKTCETI